MGENMITDVEDVKSEEKQNDKLQKVNVPKIIKILSLIYIIASIVLAFLRLCLMIKTEGHASMEQLQYAVSMFGHVVTGFLFWGVGQVFSKFMENNK